MTKTVSILVLTLMTCFLLCSCGVPFRNCGYVDVAEVKVEGCSSKDKECIVLYGNTVNVTAILKNPEIFKKKFKSTQASIKQYGFSWKVPVSLDYGKSHLEYNVSIVTGKTELLKRPAILNLKSYHEKKDYLVCVDFDVHVT